MGKLLVVGSVALDTVRTPFGEATEVLGAPPHFFRSRPAILRTSTSSPSLGKIFPRRI